MRRGLKQRRATLRLVADACRLVTGERSGPAGEEFKIQVVSAVSEAFNNIALHSYAGRERGAVIELEIQTRPDEIRVELRDWGASFDPSKVPAPDLGSLPESGMGMYIVQAFMRFRYRPGSPNVLTLTKTFSGSREGEA